MTCTICGIELPNGCHWNTKYCIECKKIVLKGSIKTVIEKACSRCGIIKPIEAFHKCKKNADGHNAACKSCRNQMAKIAGEEKRALLPLVLRQCLDCQAYLAPHDSKNKLRCDGCRDIRRMEQYQVHLVARKKRYAEGHRSPSIIAKALKNRAVEGFCSGCGTYEKLHRDHDHACCGTKSFSSRCGNCERGFLCGSCNRGLGLLKDSPEVLQNLIKYLASYENSL